MAADLELICVPHANEAAGEIWHELAVIGGAPADLFLRIRIRETVTREVAHRAFAAGGTPVVERRPEPPSHVIGHADVQCAAPALAQPVRKPDVVGVHVRHHHPQHRQSFELRAEDLLPQHLDLVTADAAVDDCPALAPRDAIAQQPQVDVVEHERQWHPHPAHAGRKLHGAARFGHDVAHGILQLLLEGIHFLCSPDLTARSGHHNLRLRKLPI